MKRVIWGIIIFIFPLIPLVRNTYDSKGQLIFLVSLIIIGILLILSGRKYLLLRKGILKTANEMNDDLRKIDVKTISTKLNCSEFETRLIISEAQKKQILPLDAEISYTGKGNTECYIPYATSERKGWEIILTTTKIYFIMIYKIPTIHTILWYLSTPLYLLPVIGGLVDLINMYIVIGILKNKTKNIQQLSIDEKLNRFTKSFSFELNEIKSVDVRKKNITFNISDNSMEFRLCKKIDIVCPQFKSYLQTKNIEIIS
ncbi:hypothetical protein JW935_23915 [candidate division KSB1 bacterium]|nr:hypothetical protein [candidate division KSB1 bacterium]